MKKSLTTLAASIVALFLSTSLHAEITLNGMMGKHYKICSVELFESLIPFEGDVCLFDTGLTVAYGDGSGNVDELHIYSIDNKSSNTKWDIDGDVGKGAITIFPKYTAENPTKIKINITDGGRNNIFILENKPYEKPTLK